MSACPWSAFLPSSVNFCEQNLCAWIVTPASTFSNIAYVICAIVIARRSKVDGRNYVNFFSVSALAIGFGSSANHATATFIGEVLDLLAMFLLSACMLSLNLQRFLGWSNRRSEVAYGLIVSGSVGVMLIFKSIGIPLFTFEFFFALGLEYLIYIELRGGTNSIDYGDLKKALWIFAVAFGVWVLDFAKILCWPDNHIFTAHAMWHVLAAVAIFYFFKFYMPLMSRRTQTNG